MWGKSLSDLFFQNDPIGSERQGETDAAVGACWTATRLDQETPQWFSHNNKDWSSFL